MRSITFCTNTAKNTLEYTKLLLRSLKENLDYDKHEILVFVDSDNDGTADYLRSVKGDFYDLKIVTHSLKPIVGPQRNINLLVELASHDTVSYLQSDMVVSKHYDTQVLKDLEEDCILSSTRIEPPLHGLSDKTFTVNFGLTPDEFQWDSFVSYADTVKSNKTLEYFFSPFSFYKRTWKKIGGMDTLFRRSREDSDLVQRCMHLNIKLKQSFASNVYHFTCVSSRGKNWYDRSNQLVQSKVALQQQADAIEMRKFIRKWGSFNHGEGLLKKLDTDLVLKGIVRNRESLVYSIEPFFSRVWFCDESSRDSVMALNGNENLFANQLYGFTEEDWRASERYYNRTEYSSIYLVGMPQNANTLVEIDLDRVTNSDEFLKNISWLYQILESAEPGTYELGCATITVRRIVELTPLNTSMTNPQFDRALLRIE